MKLNVQIRTVSRNGQVALPRRFLEALGVTPPGKVQIVQERRALIIRPSPMTRMSDEAFQSFLSRIRARNARLTQKQAAHATGQVRRGR